MEATKGSTAVTRANSSMFANDRIEMGKRHKGYCSSLNLPDDVPKIMSQAGVVNPKLNSFHVIAVLGLLHELATTL